MYILLSDIIEIFYDSTRKLKAYKTVAYYNNFAASAVLRCLDLKFKLFVIRNSQPRGN